MKKSKDHAAMREKVAAATCELISEGGLENVTIREVARRLGASIAVVQHYFANKHDLVLFVHRYINIQARNEIEGVLDKHEFSLIEGVQALLPLNDHRRRIWKVWAAYLGLLSADETLRAAQLKALLGARSMIEMRIAKMVKHGYADPSIDCAEIARMLFLHVHAIALESIFDPRGWPRHRQLSVIAEECERRLWPAGHSARSKRGAQAGRDSKAATKALVPH